MPVCFLSGYWFLAASGSLYFWEGCLQAEYVVVYHRKYGSLRSDLAILLRLIGRLFCMEQKSKQKIR